jgi:hypothetical protein
MLAIHLGHPEAALSVCLIDESSLRGFASRGQQSIASAKRIENFKVYCVKPLFPWLSHQQT